MSNRRLQKKKHVGTQFGEATDQPAERDRPQVLLAIQETVKLPGVDAGRAGHTIPAQSVSLPDLFDCDAEQVHRKPPPLPIVIRSLSDVNTRNLDDRQGGHYCGGMKRIDRKVLGQRIRALREAQGLRQEDLAARAMVNQSYLSQIENGKRDPSLDVLERIADALGIPVADLLREPETEAPTHEDFAVWYALIERATERDRRLAMEILARSLRENPERQSTRSTG
ncbi:MAG: helix-turn-helix transcriptional regulator [Thermomicrobium sp.]|nr:helix-turn-helix transcriptional regulator [Thermomicrobium sp.]MDW8060018.1 helix-turn-helix transcriptional regulator [Thermomicrobium sp.]